MHALHTASNCCSCAAARARHQDPSGLCRHRAELPPDLLLAADTACSYSADILSPQAQAGVRQRDNWQGRGECYSFEVAMKVQGRASPPVLQ